MYIAYLGKRTIASAKVLGNQSNVIVSGFFIKMRRVILVRRIAIAKKPLIVICSFRAIMKVDSATGTTHGITGPEVRDRSIVAYRHVKGGLHRAAVGVRHYQIPDILGITSNISMSR